MKKQIHSTGIAIIGMACHYPGADNITTFWENILARKRQFRTIPDIRLPLAHYYDPDPTAPDKTYNTKAALIDGYSYDWAKHRTPKSTVDSTDLAHWLALDVALQALQDAGFSKNTLPKDRSGTILGNTLTGEQTRAEGLRLRWPFVSRSLEAAAREKGLTPKTIDELLGTMEMYYKSVFAPITEDTLAGGLSNTIAGRICNYLDIHGGGYTVDGACSSSLIAVYTAANALTNGNLDIALAGGVDISLDTFELIGFAKTGALSKRDMTVYDRHADGFFPGEGCGFVVLQRLENAIKERKNIYAVLRGWGISSDGKGGLTAPNPRGQALALQRAYDVAGYGIQEVDFFEGHGTGTPVGDKAEVEAIALALGEEECSLRSHGITSLKSIIGHTKAASGIGGFIKAVIAVNRRVLPPTANCVEPAGVFNDTAKTVYPILAGEALPESTRLRAGVSAMGFGGINCHVTVESHGDPTKHLAPRFDERKLLASWQETELFVMGASSITELKDRVRHILQLAAGMSEAELVDLAYRLTQKLDPEAQVRASIITGSPDALNEALLFLEKKLARTPPAEGEVFVSRRKDIFIGNRVQACRVGFLFPGQGSQLLNMAKVLVDRHDWAQELVRKADEWLADAGGPQVAQTIFRPLERATDNKEVMKWQEFLKPTETAQPAICMTSLLWLEKLSRLGIRPDVVAGHSLGELTAFHAAGILNAETLMRFASFRGQAMAASAKQSGAMASLACPVERATEIINSVNGYVVVANINSPKQTVISGEKESVAEAVELARNSDIKTHLLETSNAFHSKFAQKAADTLRTCPLIPQSANAFKVKVFSGINGIEILPGSNLPNHFADQAITPVNFISLIETMAGECDLMVEVGPGKILSRLVDNIVFEPSPVCLPIEADSGQYRNLNTVAGNYFVRGGTINWKAFHEDRLIRPFTPAEKRSFIESPCERPFKVPSIPKQPDTGSTETIESALTAAMDISPSMLAKYLRLRGKFLETVIKGDIENLPQFRVQASPILRTDKAVSVTDIPELPNLVKMPRTTETESDTSIENILYEMIEKRTGFPQQTLSPELRLLDNLNLDSIKAGDLLAEIAIKLKISGDFDVSRFANATLGEIADAFEGLEEEKKRQRDTGSFQESTWDEGDILSVIIQKVTDLLGMPPEAVRADALLEADLDLRVEDCRKLIKEISQELGTELNVDLPPLLDRRLRQVATIVERILLSRQARKSPPRPIAHQSWVRDIYGELVETPSVSTEMHQGRRYEDKWQHARVLVLGSDLSGSVPSQLRRYLHSLGAEVTLQKLEQDGDPDRIERDAAYSHLILLLPQEAGEAYADEVHLEETIARLASIASPPPAAAGPRRRTTVAYIQFGGGRFGMDTEAGYLNRCCASALAKSLHLERDDLRVRVLDFDPALPALTVAEKIAAELHMVDNFAAVGYDGSLIRRELKQRVLSPADYRDRPFSWSKEDVVLVTGGAKGITAACALGVAQATGAHMALLGRSPHPDEHPESGDMEIASTLEKYAAAGLTVQYFRCDVSDHGSLKKAIRQIRKTMGPITGVIHGAGLNVPRLISQVSIQEALQEVSPKILGIINLMTELKDSPPRLFVGLSSIIGITGMPGNGWYGFSNESLDILLHRIEADFPSTKTLSVAFSIWQEEGMGSRMGSVSVLKQKGIESIPTEEGVKRFIRLFVKDPGVHQVIIAARLSGLDTWHWHARIPEPRGRFLEEPLHVSPGVESVFQAHLDLETDPYLRDHLFNGSFLFPTVFGLEAMAQAVAHVTGQHDFGRLKIENIQLKRPITVDPEVGADIVVWAELTESESPSSVQTVQAGIYKQGAGQGTDYFSATFVLGLTAEPAQCDIGLPDVPLDIRPKEDLYDRGILFQGPRFQRLQHIYSLDSRKCVFDSEYQALSSDNADDQWLLGDPYFRDSLLHSTQLPVSQHVCLPMYITSLERFRITDAASCSLRGLTVIDDRTEKEVHGSVMTMDETGLVVERIDGYVAKIMKFHQEYPSAEDLADPGNRDETIIDNEIKRRAAFFNLDLPDISIASFSGLKKRTKEQRRELEIPIIQETVRKVFDRSGEKGRDIEISWLDSGKPILSCEDYSGWNFSLSHDRETVLSIAGIGSQGCDIESITHRSNEDWLALLGKKRASLLETLVGSPEPMDKAGTRIWTAVEAAFKASGSKNTDLRIEKKESGSVLFRRGGSGNGENMIFTFPVTLTRGPERMVAVTVSRSEKKVAPALPAGKGSYADLLNFDMESYQVQIENGPQDQPVFVFRFPVTFKEASNVSKTLYFTHYFVWLGKLREYMIQPIYEKLVEYFSTGKWGMVTNRAETQIWGEAKSGDVIEGRLWVDKISGKEKSTLDFIFEWRKKDLNREYNLIASSKMSTTWVSVHGHGNAEIEPFPEFGREFINTILPKAPLDTIPETTREKVTDPDFGCELFQEPVGPVRASALLIEKVFETCLEDSNLVGNIYFSNYYIWLGRVRDHLLYEIAPEYLTGSGKHGELRCVRCEVNHMNEAMPHDRIVVRMYRSAVYEKGFRFNFDFFKLSAEGVKQKLGFGVHEAIWYMPTQDRMKWVPSKLPKEILAAVVPKDELKIQEVQPRQLKKDDKKYDVIVVGAGIGGLTAASLLTKQGAKVAVIEQNNKPGGFCTSWERRVNIEGRTLRYIFDAGVHDILGLGPKGYVRKLLKELNLENKIDWLRVDHQYIFPNLQMKVPRGIDAYGALLCNTFPHERNGITAFIEEISRCFSELYEKTSGKSRISRWLDVPFCKMLDTFVNDNLLKEVLSTLHYYITDDISKVKSLVMLPMFGYYIDGGYYPSGGSQVFPDMLANYIKEKGGDIFLNTAVSRVVIDSQRVSGVELNSGRKMYSRFVIANSDVKRTFCDLIDSSCLHDHYYTQIISMRPSNSAFMVNLGVDFVPGVEPMTMVIGEERSVGIMIPSKVDPSIAPEGHAAVTLLGLIPNSQAATWNRRDKRYRENKAKKGDELISVAEKAIPNLRQHILYRQDASPATFSRYAWASEGAIYGTQIDSWKPSAKTPIKGLFLASASITTRPGVGDAVNAGMICSEAILRVEKHV